ncbi:hypothetical protein ACFFX0_24560 [Citricoccus parietis]|uniref:Uncharacterized protein n=1 Tax=Citricoccus parietis TaxID=592307 RepID=A0ABV5G6D6_9MICC
MFRADRLGGEVVCGIHHGRCYLCLTTSLYWLACGFTCVESDVPLRHRRSGPRSPRCAAGRDTVRDGTHSPLSLRDPTVRVLVCRDSSRRSHAGPTREGGPGGPENPHPQRRPEHSRRPRQRLP